MVSCGPDVQNVNYTHMYSFVDYRNFGKSSYCTVKGSMYDYIASNSGMTKIKKIIEMADIEGILSDLEANYTLFIPLDSELQHISECFFETMDKGLARQIVLSSIIVRQLDKKLLQSSPVSYYITRDPKMRMYVTNINGITKINNCLNVTKFNIPCTNGIIHLTNGLIVPSEDHFMN